VLGGETSQKESLLKAARSHESKAEQASIQSYGWYGGATCYAGMAMAGQFNVNKALIIKLGAAAFLGTFYLEEKMLTKNTLAKLAKLPTPYQVKAIVTPSLKTNVTARLPSTPMIKFTVRIIRKRHWPSSLLLCV